MKSLIVFYSLEGNCKFISEEIQAITKAEILRLKPIKDIKSKGFSKYIWGGKQVVMKIKPKLEAIDKNINDYDLIFLGTPVWAGSFAPAINTFLSENEIKNKKIVLFCCSGGGKGKTFEQLKEKLKGNEILGEFDFIEPLSKNKNEVNKEIEGWINKLVI